MRLHVKALVTALVLALLIVPFAMAGGQQEGGGGQQEVEEEDGDMATNPTDNPWTNGQDLSGRTVNIFGAFVDTDAEFFEESMIPFEEATGIDIEYEGSGDFESLITVRTEGGDPPARSHV